LLLAALSHLTHSNTHHTPTHWRMPTCAHQPQAAHRRHAINVGWRRLAVLLLLLLAVLLRQRAVVPWRLLQAVLFIHCLVCCCCRDEVRQLQLHLFVWQLLQAGA
jgi:hypothetical protein